MPKKNSIPNKSKFISVIDIGAHSTKMQIGSISETGKIKKIEDLWVPIPIGKDTFNKGVVTNSTISDLINILKNFKTVMDTYKVEHYKAIATSGIREAANSDTLLERMFNDTGIKVEVIEQIEEAKILYDGIKKLFKTDREFLKGNILIFAIGGGSSLIIYQSDGKIIFTETHNIGTLRLQKNFDASEKSIKISLKYIIFRFLNSLKIFSDIPEFDKLIVLNDDIINILKKTKYGNIGEEIFRLNKDNLKSLCKTIENNKIEKIKEDFKINDNLVKTSKIGFLIIEMFYNLIAPKEIVFADVSLSSSLLSNLTVKDDTTSSDIKQSRENIIASSISIGKKYKFDFNHAFQIKKFSLIIFDYLKNYFIFNPKANLYLEVASLLHDIGYFISSKNHHRHSERIIAASEIIGLNSDEMNLISQIARYHRKGVPKKSHNNYIELSMEYRVMVSQLAGILRVADSLDGANTQLVEKLKLNIKEGICELFVKIKNNNYDYLDILRTNVKSKSDLFENFFGLSIKIEKM